MKIIFALVAALLLSLPHLAHAATETRHYRGEMEFVSVSGSSCGSKIKHGDRIAINLAVRISGENFDGYYAGKNILTGHFSGDSTDKLSVSYLGEKPAAQSENHLSLFLSGNSPGGELREKSLAASEPGCNFDMAKLVLVPEASGNTADCAFDKLEKRFKAEYENNLATQKFDEGNMPEAISHFETEIKLLEDIDGVASETLIDPLLILSIAYCASERFTKGKELQDRVFALPMEALKRKIWRVGVMQKLFAQQASRLAQEGKAEKGIALLESAVAAYPDLTRLYVHMAEMMIELDATQEACIHIESAWSRHRNDGNIQNAKALCLAWKGRTLKDTDNPDVSIALFEQAWKLSQDNLAILFELCSAYIDKGAPETAISLIKENAEKLVKEFGQKNFDRYQAAVYAAVGNSAAKKLNYSGAETNIRAALKLDPVNISYTLKLANVVHKSGRFEETLRILDSWQKKCLDAACREQTTKAIDHERQLEVIVKKLNSY